LSLRNQPTSAEVATETIASKFSNYPPHSYRCEALNIVAMAINWHKWKK